MRRLEEEMQQARKKFADEKQKLTEELVRISLYNVITNYYDYNLWYRMESSQSTRLKWTKIER